MKALIYSDQTTLAGEMIALAKEANLQPCAFAFSNDEAQELSAYGAEKVYLLEGANPRPEAYTKTMAKILSEEPAIFLAGATVRGREVAAGTACLVGCTLISDANRVKLTDGLFETDRMIYGGMAVQTERFAPPAVIVVPAGKYTAIKYDAGKAETITIPAETDDRVKQVKVEEILRQGADITKASKIVCVGMGFDKKEDLSIAQNLADALGAEIAATRPVTEDRKWLPVELYVGISGAVISPDLYIGMGLSGQIQHTYGIRDSKIIVGINNNDKAPIFQVADYGIVGDMYEIAPLLTEAVKGRVPGA